MKTYVFLLLPLALIGASLCSLAQSSTSPAGQQPNTNQQPQSKLPPVQQTIEVTATRLPENPEEVPVGIQVFSGEELGERGIRDMRGVLGLATGVSISPGGDSGPATF